jgi:Mg2+ and Co2+ transporter CorA
MNVPLARFPGSDAAQFWWVFAVMTAVVIAMLIAFRRKRWI